MLYIESKWRQNASGQEDDVVGWVGGRGGKAARMGWMGELFVSCGSAGGSTFCFDMFSICFCDILTQAACHRATSISALSARAMAGAHRFVGYRRGYIAKVHWAGGWQPLSCRVWVDAHNAEMEVARWQSANPRGTEWGFMYRVMWTQYPVYRTGDAPWEYAWDCLA